MPATLGRAFYTWLGTRRLHMARRFGLTVRGNGADVTGLGKERFATVSLYQKVYALAEKGYTSFESPFEFGVKYPVLYTSNQ